MSEPLPDIKNYNERVVRDLFWCITCPSLTFCHADHIDVLEENWLWNIYNSPRDFLNKLDASPEKLHQLLENRRDYRLGHYFECLLTYWFEHSDYVDIIKSNYSVVVNRQTVGEFDYILLDKRSGKTLHIEVAAKFYLGFGDDTLSEHDFWGPGLKDRLDKKLLRMEKHQTCLSRRIEVKRILDEEQIHIDKIICLIKGRLFYPAFNLEKSPGSRKSTQAPGAPDKLSKSLITNKVTARFESSPCTPISYESFSRPGDLSRFRDSNVIHQYYWYYYSQWLNKKFNKDEVLVRLTKNQWFSPLFQTDINKEQYLKNNPEITKPVCISRIEAGSEVERFFIVPDNWLPER